MLKPLREYQQSALDYRLHPSRYDANVCLQLPTGTGKSEIIKHEHSFYRTEGLRTLIVTPNRRLVANLSSQIENVATAHTGIIPDLSKDTLITTYQSAAKYVQQFKPDRMITDECHYTVTTTSDRVLKLAGNIPHTGYTATPNRLDGTGLYKHFQHLHEAPQMRWFIEQGYLADYELYQSQAPLFEASTDALDLQETIMIPQISNLVEHYLTYCKNEKTIIFATTIKHGELICEALRTAKIKVVMLSSKSSKTDQDFYFQAFKDGLIDCLVNVQLFTEGVDVPDATTVLLARFTYSTALYLQMIGRVLRPFPGKLAKIIDLAGNAYYHGQPKNSFYWSLEGQQNLLSVAKNNQSTLYFYCEECQQSLTHKKYVTDKTVICCLNCQNENYVAPVIPKLRGSKMLHTLFRVDELVKLSDTQITELTRVLTSNERRFQYKPQARIEAVLNLSIAAELKRKGLKYLKVKDDVIDFYLD